MLRLKVKVACIMKFMTCLKESLMKRTRLKKVSERGLIKRKEAAERTKQLHLVMYNWWNSFGSYKRCMSCNCLLPMEFSTMNVDHLLSKSKYPDLAFDEDNFFLCCGHCHTKKENGFPTDKHKQAIEKVKLKL